MRKRYRERGNENVKAVFSRFKSQMCFQGLPASNRGVSGAPEAEHTTGRTAQCKGCAGREAWVQTQALPFASWDPEGHISPQDTASQSVNWAAMRCHARQGAGSGSC